VEEFNDREALQNQLTLDIIACAGKVPDADFNSVVTNADELGILASPGDANRIKGEANTRERLARYTSLLRLRNGDEDPRTAALTVHKAKVCKLAKAS
jgi:hypothetical protein